jgi:hypothetical protein
MKYITLVIGLLLVGCGKQEEADTNESTPTTTEKPVKELTLREKAIGTYEAKEGEDTIRVVLLETGIGEGYENGKKLEIERKWSVVKGEIHVKYSGGFIRVWRINKDKSITYIADIDKDGERIVLITDGGTFKKIK